MKDNDSVMLTGFETQVLQLAAAGFYPEDIAERLALSSYTVEMCLFNIVTKLNAGNVREAVAMAVSKKMI